MSAIHSVFYEFKEKCKAKNAIVTYTIKHNEFWIYVYCLQKDIDIKIEANKLKNLCFKHGIYYHRGYGCQFWELPTLTQIISICPSYSSIYVFSFNKKQPLSFFFNKVIFFVISLPLENSKEMPINIYSTNIFFSILTIIFLCGKMYLIHLF